jgi:DNA-binding CsgD family transcriptional regulator
VEMHLANACRKLGGPSRTQLAAALGARGDSCEAVSGAG